MALTRTSRGSASATGANNAVTGSFTPSDTSLLVAMIGGLSAGNGDPTGTNAVSGGTLTWTKQATTKLGDVDAPTWVSWAEIWTAPVTTGASMTVTSNPGNTQDGHYVSVIEYTGYNTSSPIGATATGTRSFTAGSWTITLSGTPAATSEVPACVAVDNYNDAGAGVITFGTGWTELHDFPTAGPETIGQSQVRGSSTSTSVLWDLVDADPTTACAVAVEIKVAAAGGTTDAAASGAGAATATATGRSSVAVAGSAAGVATATATGRSVVSAAGSSASTSTVTAEGRSTVAVPASSAGTATATATGAALTPAAASSAGTATAAAEGRSVVAVAANSAGIATATAEGRSSVRGDAYSAGAATAIAAGAGGEAVTGDSNTIAALIWRQRRQGQRAA